MAKRRAKLSNETTHKTTLAESPEATRKLTEIKTEEVSVVDFPANGEPFFVMKSLNKEKVEKASREQIPLEKMKELHQRLSDIKKTLELVDEELSNSKVEKSVDEEPVILKGLFNNVILTLKKIRGEDVEEPLDFETISKKYEEVEKGNAVSYLTRDRYSYVTQSVSEYVTTYLDGIEHDDDGPMLIPLGLDSGVEDSLEKMEDVVEEEKEISSEKVDSKETNRIEKLEEELSSLKKTLDSANVSTEDVNKKGSKISKDRLKKLKSISKDIGNAHDQMMKFLEDLDISSEQEETAMSEKTETTEKAAEKEEEAVEKSVEKTDDVVEKNSEDNFDKLIKKFDLLCKTLDDKFEALEKSSNERFEKLEETQKEVNSEIQKFSSLRVDSRVDAKDETASVEKSAEELKKEKASFKNIFGLA